MPLTFLERKRLLWGYSADYFCSTFLLPLLWVDTSLQWPSNEANEMGHPVWWTLNHSFFFFFQPSYVLFFVCLQFFYLVTETYKMGGLKEMQRWAYEIFSCYLVPDAPLRLSNLEHSTIEDIDRYDNNNTQNIFMMCKQHTITRGKFVKSIDCLYDLLC